MRSQSKTSVKLQPYVLEEGTGCQNRSVARLKFDDVNIASSHASNPSVTAPIEFGGVTAESDLLKEELRIAILKLETQLEDARKTADAVRMECSAELAHNLDLEQKRFLDFLAKFERERTHYFATAETEIVKLSLAIAAHVLQREAKLDPLLLRGVVRVELERIQDAGAVQVRVPAGEVEIWKNVLDGVRSSSLQLIGDEQLDPGDCLLDSNAGQLNLSVKSQLHEIERGFFDLLEKKPA